MPPVQRRARRPEPAWAYAPRPGAATHNTGSQVAPTSAQDCRGNSSLASPVIPGRGTLLGTPLQPHTPNSHGPHAVDGQGMGQRASHYTRSFRARRSCHSGDPSVMYHRQRTSHGTRAPSLGLGGWPPALPSCGTVVLALGCAARTSDSSWAHPVGYKPAEAIPRGRTSRADGLQRQFLAGEPRGQTDCRGDSSRANLAGRTTNQTPTAREGVLTSAAPLARAPPKWPPVDAPLLPPSAGPRSKFGSPPSS